jgi:hypothetical protein
VCKGIPILAGGTSEWHCKGHAPRKTAVAAIELLTVSPAWGFLIARNKHSTIFALDTPSGVEDLEIQSATLSVKWEIPEAK